MNYPLLNLFWTMLLFFGFVIWLLVLFRVLTDIFRSHDLSGPGKAGWLVLTILLPFIGVVCYIIARGGGMAAREARELEHTGSYGRNRGS